MDTSPQSTTLRRSATNRVVAGVAGGLGEYFKIDPTLVRVVFVILTIWHLLGPLIYIVLWVIMPEAERSATDKPAADNVAMGMAPSTAAPSYIDGRSLGGLAIIAVGIFILLNNLGIYWDMQWNILWPFLLIVGGVLFLLRR